mmetsp:Transcript_17656/g.43402  ORF Transcript_17656/g.43402 Transcript_17656/m.43402 type:complete len:179 (+) Transcript_17656:49-585(+)
MSATGGGGGGGAAGVVSAVAAAVAGRARVHGDGCCGRSDLREFLLGITYSHEEMVETTTTDGARTRRWTRTTLKSTALASTSPAPSAASVDDRDDASSDDSGAQRPPVRRQFVENGVLLLLEGPEVDVDRCVRLMREEFGPTVLRERATLSDDEALQRLQQGPMRACVCCQLALTHAA